MGDLFNKPATAEERIETLSDVLLALCKMFPRQAAEIDAWTASYARVLGNLTGEELRRAFHGTIDTWTKTSAPKPSDFRVNVPVSTRPRDPQAAAQIRANEITRAAHSERDALVDRTLKAYADTIAAYGREFANYPSDQVGSAVVTPADCVRAAVVLRVKNKAWPLAVETAGGGTPYAHVDLSPADWENIRQHAETMCRNNGGNAARALHTRPNPWNEARRAEMIRRAEEWRQRHEGGGEPITAEERQAALEGGT